MIRLYGITNPPLEVSHNWRQTTVTMPARNFLEVDNNIFYPRIDIAGELTGITGMEFPLLNYLIYLVSLIFGYTHWYGRLINLLVSSVGVFYFARFVKLKFGDGVSLFSIIALLSSIWLAYSRKVMPDTFATSLAIIGVYYACEYLDKVKLKHLLLYAVFTCLALLSKLPVVVTLSILLYYFWTSKIGVKSKVTLVITSFIVVLPAVWWYFIWVPSLVDDFGFHHFFMGKSMTEGFYEMLEYWPGVVQKFYFDSFFSYSAIVVFLYGVYLIIKKKQFDYIVPFLISFGFIFIIILKSGWTFAHHSYYIIPFVPIMAIVLGYALNEVKLRHKYGYVLCIIVVLECFGNQWHDVRIKPNYKALIGLEKELDSFSSRDDLVVINSGDYPTPMYFAHRKGWVKSNDQLTEESLIKLRSKGCKYLIVLRKVFGEDKIFPLKEIRANDNWRVYQL